MLEELSATHTMSYNELGNMDAEVVEGVWASYWKRKSLDVLEEGRRSLIMALYANGNLGGDDLRRVLSEIEATHEDTRKKIILGTDEDLDVEGEFLSHAPFLGPVLGGASGNQGERAGGGDHGAAS